MNETFEQFCERMGFVERRDMHFIGNRAAGNVREVFDFEGQICFLETYNMPDYNKLGISDTAKACLMAFGPKPSFHWIYASFFYGKERVRMVMKQYGATRCEEDPYTEDPDNWFSLVFDDDKDNDGFAKMMRLVWDVHTGKFKKQFGNIEEEAWTALEKKKA
jgi:hypothetical protein